jgi:hypothetical protein
VLVYVLFCDFWNQTEQRVRETLFLDAVSVRNSKLKALAHENESSDILSFMQQKKEVKEKSVACACSYLSLGVRFTQTQRRLKKKNERMNE